MGQQLRRRLGGERGDMGYSVPWGQAQVGAHRHRSLHGTVAWVRVRGDGHAGGRRGGDQDVERAPLPRPPSGRGRSTASASAGPWGSRAAPRAARAAAAACGVDRREYRPGGGPPPGSLFWAEQLIALPRPALEQGSRSSLPSRTTRRQTGCAKTKAWRTRHPEPPAGCVGRRRVPSGERHG